MPTLTLPYHFAPRSYQWDVYDAWDQGKRRFCLVWHRRAGKSKTLLNFTIERMLERTGNYTHVFPSLKQARRVIWNGIDKDGKRYLDHFPPELVYSVHEQDMRVTLRDTSDSSKPGSTYQLLGTDYNLNVLVGSNPVGTIWDEYALQNPRAWELCRPILRENGGWAIFPFTPRGKNHGFQLYTAVKDLPDWHVSYLTVRQTIRDGEGEDGTPVLSEADIQADRDEGMDEADILQEYFCAWETPMPGAVYGKELRIAEQEGRIGTVYPRPGYAVHTCWDIGRHDANAIWYYQPLLAADGRMHYYFVDYDEDVQVALPDWVKRVREKAYRYDAGEGECHYAPHDMGQTDYSTRNTRAGIARESVLLADGRTVPGLHFRIVARGPLEDGIAATRRLLSVSHFDEHRCEQGLNALRSYRYEWDEALGIYTKEPVHDWASHGADALRCGAVGMLGQVGSPQPKPIAGSFEHWRQNARRARHGRPVTTFRT